MTTPAFLGGQGERGNPVASSTTVAPLPERIDALNYSMDPWESTARKVGRTICSSRSCLYKGIFSYDHRMPILSPFGTTAMAPSGGTSAEDDAFQTAPRRLGKASNSVSIFARAPVCKDTCRYTAGLDPVMLRLTMTTTLAMTVSNGFSAAPWLRLLVPPVFRTEMLRSRPT